jgi:hypothetical protein
VSRFNDFGVTHSRGRNNLGIHLREPFVKVVEVGKLHKQPVADEENPSHLFLRPRHRVPHVTVVPETRKVGQETGIRAPVFGLLYAVWGDNRR